MYKQKNTFRAENTEVHDSIERLVTVLDRLIAPDGCPWDSIQTHSTILNNFIEEVYEFIEAVDKGDIPEMKEELGDLLLHVVFQSKIAEKNGSFTLGEVAHGIADKLIGRHPHIFGDHDAQTVDDVWRNWEKIKKEEKKHTRTYLLEGIPNNLPSLIKALKVQSKAARVGFDWADARDVLPKLTEEVRELTEEIAAGRLEGIEDELGDLLFAAVNLGRKLEIDPERALRGTIAKFIRRFAFIEDEAKRLGVEIDSLSLAQMDALWEKAKTVEG